LEASAIDESLGHGGDKRSKRSSAIFGYFFSSYCWFWPIVQLIR